LRRDILQLIPAVFLLSMILPRCANPTTPIGGPKDIAPPEVITCSPPNFSTSFNVKTIHIEFNEFISLKATGNEVLLSPPMPEKPEVKARGKSIIVDFGDTLRPETTYILVFESAISDITENNILPEFRYVWSTGNYLDSLTISGSVTDAYTLQPVADCFVFLYSAFHDSIPADSLPYLIPPEYLTKTNSEGKFRFTNLRHEAFLLFALEDQSSDNLYNLPSERIAFADSLVIPWPMTVPVPSDSAVQTDTVQPAPEPIKKTIQLKLFQEIDSAQVLLKSEWLRKDLFRLSFRFPVKQLLLTPLNSDSSASWYLPEFSDKKDTINIWLTESVPDTLVFRIDADETLTDTVTLVTTPKQVRRKQSSDDSEKTPEIGISWNTPGGTLNHFTTNLTAQFSYPVKWYDPTRIKLIRENDTVIPEVVFTDTLRRFMQIRHPWQEDKSYALLIPDSSVVSYNDLTQDTIRYAFRTVKSRDLGSLIINVITDSITSPYIILLLDDKGKEIATKTLSKDSKLIFPYIKPGKYQIKAILDSNHNGRWDTGIYLKKKQPERVFLFPKSLEIRGNWEVEEDWILK